LSCFRTLGREGGLSEVDKVKEKISDLSEEELVKILATVRFVAKRRARGGRDYFSIIHNYVGARVASGIRVMPKGFLV